MENEDKLKLQALPSDKKEEYATYIRLASQFPSKLQEKFKEQTGGLSPQDIIKQQFEQDKSQYNFTADEAFMRQLLDYGITAADLGFRAMDYGPGLLRTAVGQAIGQNREGDWSDALHGRAPNMVEYEQRAGVPDYLAYPAGYAADMLLAPGPAIRRGADAAQGLAEWISPALKYSGKTASELRAEAEAAKTLEAKFPELPAVEKLKILLPRWAKGAFNVAMGDHFTPQAEKLATEIATTPGMRAVDTELMNKKKAPISNMLIAEGIGGGEQGVHRAMTPIQKAPGESANIGGIKPLLQTALERKKHIMTELEKASVHNSELMIPQSRIWGTNQAFRGEKLLENTPEFQEVAKRYASKYGEQLNSVGDLSPMEVDRIKTIADEIVSEHTWGAYNLTNPKTGVATTGTDRTIEAESFKKLADRARLITEETADRAKPGLGGALYRTNSRISRLGDAQAAKEIVQAVKQPSVRNWYPAVGALSAVAGGGLGASRGGTMEERIAGGLSGAALGAGLMYGTTPTGRMRIGKELLNLAPELGRIPSGLTLNWKRTNTPYLWNELLKTEQEKEGELK